MEEFLNGLQGSQGELAQTALAYLIQIAQALVILVVGWIIAGWMKALTRRSLDRMKRMDATLKPLLSNIVRYTIIIFTIVAVLAHFGVQTASIIAVVGAAGLAIGLALQGTLQNIAAGIMLLLLRPFRNGDYIEAGGIGGTVQEIGLFTTLLNTADGVFISAPNSTLWNGTIKNYSKNSTRRIDLDVGVSYDDDVNGAMEVLRTVMADDSRVLTDPVPEVMVVALADSSVNIRMRCWVNGSDYWGMLWHMNREAKLRLDAKGFTIPYPQQDVYMHQIPSSSEKTAD
ncbi:mechanosensitive ion channel family protein [Aestuariispira ectoiniformans]|uniref:mechanosensitive ion channel family protein n=1 Tax=Aestuariispira ectoiniformans TaxID=2775080 RepID=UPI00223B3657|nr:mechanosensitive ion channel domain-containing protein [Aestuariispira ectoiniformans]